MSNYIKHGETIIFHPGYYIEEFVLHDFAKRLGVDPDKFANVVNGEEPLTIDVAEKLAEATGTSIAYWMNIQAMFDAYVGVKKRKGSHKLVVKVHKATREIVDVYSSAKEAASANFADKDALARACSCQRLDTGGFYFRYAADFDPAEDFSGKRNCPVVAVNLETGERRWFSSRFECAKQMYTTEAVISKSIQKQKPARIGWIFKYEGKPTENFSQSWNAKDVLTCVYEDVEWIDHCGGKEIRRVKMVCSNCAAELEKGKKPNFCPKCGRKVVMDESEGFWTAKPVEPVS